MFLVALVLCGLMTNAQVNLQNGLVAFYPFNGNANDESGNENHGTVNGATLTTDRFGNENSSYSFDGVDDYIQLNQHFINGSFSISTWFVKNTTTDWNVLFSNGILHGDWGNGFNLYSSGDDIVFLKAPDTQGFGLNGIITINEWHNVVVVWDGLTSTNNAKMYLDNVLIDQTDCMSSVINSSYNLLIGKDVWNQCFNGKIDDIRIYDRALNEQEIIALYNENSLEISTSNQTATAGRTIEIPVLTSELTTGDNVIAYQFDYNFDNTKLEYIGNSLVGTLAEGGTLQVNPTTNKLSIAWARGTALVGEGEILKLQFKVLAVGETTPTITNALYNTESVTATNGTITAVYKYGDIDANNFVQAYDAALAIQYSVGLDPLPTIDPLPWENWRVIVADVDGTAGVTANDASEILKYTVGLISTFPVESGKKSGKTETADVNITLVGNELLFQPTGELYGLNVNATENISVLGQPQFLNANMLNATNINANTYSIGLATANAPTENETFMKIPVTLTQNTNITFDLIINTTVKSVTVSGTTGIVTINDKAVSIYPNPTNSILYVNGLQNANVQIFDLTGKLLINQQNADNQIDVSNLQNGIYSIKITNESGTVIRKFVKQ